MTSICPGSTILHRDLLLIIKLNSDLHLINQSINGGGGSSSSSKSSGVVSSPLSPPRLLVRSRLLSDLGASVATSLLSFAYHPAHQISLLIPISISCSAGAQGFLPSLSEPRRRTAIAIVVSSFSVAGSSPGDGERGGESCCGCQRQHGGGRGAIRGNEWGTEGGGGDRSTGGSGGGWAGRVRLQEAAVQYQAVQVRLPRTDDGDGLKCEIEDLTSPELERGEMCMELGY